MPKKENLLNQKFGRLLVIEPCENINGRTAWKCQCECGNVIKVISKSLKNGNTQSCGCLHKEIVSKQFSKNIINQRFGKLIAICPTNERKHGSVVWKCICDCGNEHYATAELLLSDHCLSCGCLKSKGENKIKKILQQENILFVQQFPVLINGAKYYFDFGIYNDNGQLDYLIEYDGEHHYKSSERGWHTTQHLKVTQYRDQLKNHWCKTNNIKLIRIPYWDYDKIDIKYIKEKEGAL